MATPWTIATPDNPVNPKVDPFFLSALVCRLQEADLSHTSLTRQQGLALVSRLEEQQGPLVLRRLLLQGNPRLGLTPSVVEGVRQRGGEIDIDAYTVW